MAAFNAEAIDVWSRYSQVVADARHEEAQLLQRATTTAQRMITLLTRGHLTARNESRREELTRILVRARQPLIYQAQTRLGWPTKLIEAQSAMTDHLARNDSQRNPNGQRT